jgi:hypothetical protein
VVDRWRLALTRFTLSWRAARLNQRAKLQRLSLVRPLARA